MDSNTILQDLASTIDQSQHKSLLLSGLSVLSEALKGEEIDLSVMNESIRDSVKILAEDIDEEMSTKIVAPLNPHIPALMLGSVRTDTLRRYAGKCVKKELLKSVGETLSQEEKQQYEEDKREIVEMIIDYF